MDYIQNKRPQEGCVFCHRLQEKDGPENLIVYRGEWAYVILNLYPYTNGHLMIVPFEHQPSLEFLSAAARTEMMEMLSHAVEVLKAIYRPHGFNLGANLGEAAGAGIADHVHLHVVPRWQGDANFMFTVGGTRVMPEGLDDTYRKVKEAWLK
jgi:ATP adenylyltransferase